MRARIVVRALVLVGLLGGAALAQDPGPPRTPPANEAQRDSLELRVRARMNQMLKTQLGLTDDQVRRLAVTNRRFERQRRELFEQERRVRFDLRQALESGGDTTNVSALLDRMLQLQRQRLDLTDEEQRELATFLTPVQRARLLGMEEQIRRRMMEIRESSPRGGGPGRRPDGGPPPGGDARDGRRRPPGFES